MEQADKNENTHFDFDVYDTYQWYLDLGPYSNINAKFMHGTPSRTGTTVEHPNYDDFWRKEAWVNQLHSSPVPNLNVAGFWDQEDPWGPVADLPKRRGKRSGENQLHGRRPMVPRTVASTVRRTASAKFRSVGTTPRASSVRTFRRRSSVITFTAKARSPVEGQHLPIRLKHLAHLHRLAAQSKRSRPTSILHADGTLSFEPPAADGQKAIANMSPIPPIPVPYRQRPISPTYPGGDWRTWEAADQRFVDHRPDVISYVSAPLDHDLVVTGPFAAEPVCIHFRNRHAISS